MKFRYLYITCIILAAVSCQKGFDGPSPDPITSETGEVVIEPSMHITGDMYGYVPETKSLVGKNSTIAISSNFLRVDEAVASDNSGTYTFTPWSQATILEGNAASSPDNSQYSIRALSLAPTQTYRIKGEKLSADTYRIDNYYHTRMVGWYPQTCQLAENTEGKKITTGIDAARDAHGQQIYSVEDNRTYIHFNNLGIDKDLMMTDMREGQQWHAENSSAASDYLSNGTSVYRQPFGYYEGTPSYSNFFTFRHYRSAIRLYAEADQSEQNLLMWGTILSVRILNQPTACKIRIPETVGTFADYANGDIIWDSDSKGDFTILTDAMFSGDPDRENLNQTVEYPVELDGATSSSRVYLGYALVRPNEDVDIELHTTSGIYSVTLKAIVTDKETQQQTQVLNPGHFYNITMSLQTKGAITEVLEARDDEVYYDLSKEQTLDGELELTGLRYANCYIVDPKNSHVTTALTEYNQKVNADLEEGANTINKTRYDGFAFCASVVGNGEAGIISNNFIPKKSVISPYSARLIWETSRGLVTNIELIHGYVRFKVKYSSDDKTNLNTEKGNALIGVYDKDNKLIWSWHIWITDTPSEVTVSDSKFLDRNLGAIVANPNSGDEALLSYGLYYQWGRKDPSMYPPSYDYPIKSLLTSAYYDYASEEKTASDVRQYTQPTLSDALLYPQYLILPTTMTGGNYAYNWMYDNYSDLWGEGSDLSITKTIYDPCPYGYRVPGGELKTSVEAVSGSMSKSGYGWKYTSGSSVFFLPFAGFKGEDKNSNSAVCSWLDVGKRGDYQTARISHSSTEMYHRERVFISSSSNDSWSYFIGDKQNTYSGSYNSDYTNRRTAAPVRCVKDQKVAGTVTTGISVSLPNSHTTLVAGDVLTISYSANTSGNTTLSSISLKLNYSYDGENRSQTIATSTRNLGSSTTKTASFTVEDKTVLAHILEGGYTFTVEATNNLGRESSSNAQVSRQVIRITDISPRTATIKLNRTAQLTPTTEPSTVPDNTVKYVSSNTSVATVSTDGIVTGVSVGNATITATIETTDEYTGAGSETVDVTIAEQSGPTIEFLFRDDLYAGATTNGMIVSKTSRITWYVHYDELTSNTVNTAIQQIYRSQVTIGDNTFKGYLSSIETINGIRYAKFLSSYNYNTDDSNAVLQGNLGTYTGTFTASVVEVDSNGNIVSELESESATQEFIVRKPIVDIRFEDDWYTPSNHKIVAWAYLETCEYNNYPSSVTISISGSSGLSGTKSTDTKIINGQTYYKYTATWTVPSYSQDFAAQAKIQHPINSYSATTENKKIPRWVLTSDPNDLTSGVFLITGKGTYLYWMTYYGLLNTTSSNNSNAGVYSTRDFSVYEAYSNYQYAISGEDSDHLTISVNSNTDNKLYIKQNNKNYYIQIGSISSTWAAASNSDGISLYNNGKYLGISGVTTTNNTFSSSTNDSAQTLYIYKWTEY